MAMSPESSGEARFEPVDETMAEQRIRDFMTAHGQDLVCGQATEDVLADAEYAWDQQDPGTAPFWIGADGFAYGYSMADGAPGVPSDVAQAYTTTVAFDTFWWATYKHLRPTTKRAELFSFYLEGMRCATGVSEPEGFARARARHILAQQAMQIRRSPRVITIRRRDLFG